MDEPAEMRVDRGQRLTEAVKEDLELFAVSDLEERIDILREEIARCEAQIARKRTSLSAADALFRPKSAD